ncbi:hypothetical protein H310_12979 [Aphanomyces invadans]|uniref:AD domain-containing protein n=1 Tax=Aphanomyces invadans TaxID=157072 RepID=A0A024TFC9_9STRA|nr:hypothetical protein H310_12979 [Aphanomyces invadans]ETV92748.1 hypothetical protein H310_12979 [Aphanomyces invadans]RHY32039.1 hypothetical protein DYB32_002932 [Aphanomyces invadans]|eukprot:XP_008878518.1 hypothetical protein H310_12979 [Aphanomyces invadans]
MADEVLVELPVQNGNGVEGRNVALDTWIRVKLFDDAPLIEGSVYTLDPVSGFLVVKSVDSTQLLNIASVQSVEIIEKDEDSWESSLTARSSGPPCAVSEDKLQKLELQSRELAEKALASIGKNVSPFGQSIFDALSKTMPCHWEGQHIRVMEVVIHPPYDSKNCSSSDQVMLDRIKKILDALHRKLAKQQ